MGDEGIRAKSFDMTPRDLEEALVKEVEVEVARMSLGGGGARWPGSGRYARLAAMHSAEGPDDSNPNNWSSTQWTSPDEGGVNGPPPNRFTLESMEFWPARDPEALMVEEGKVVEEVQDMICKRDDEAL